MCQTGVYFRTRNELISKTAEWLRRNGRESVIALNCVSQILKLKYPTTLEQDLEVIVKNMEENADSIYKLGDTELFNLIKPVYESNNMFKQCGIETRRISLSMFKDVKDSRQLTGNLDIDVEKAVQMAVMYVEHGLNKNYDEY